MASQDNTPNRKPIRVDDPTLPTDETMEVYPPPVAPIIRPTTRNSVHIPSPAARMVPPEQKHASSLQRMKELNNQTRKEMEDAMMQKANQVQYQAPAVEIPQEPILEELEIQPIEQLQADLSQLISTGSISEEKVVGGFKFRLRTLNARENNEVLASIMSAKDDFEKLGRIRIAVLSRAIETVNGVPLEHVPGVDGKLPIMQRKESLIGNLQLSLVVELFNVYTNMLERSEQVFKTAADNEETLKK